LAEVTLVRSLGVRNLALWRELRQRQGRSGDVLTIQDWILERYPESPEAVEIVFFRGDAAHDRGALDEALSQYGRLQRMNSSLDRSGLARMRTGQIHLRRGDRALALESYRAYLEEYPEGRRWDEATYWIGRILLESGEGGEASRTLGTIAERNPLSYYAVRALELLGEPFRLPAGPDPPREPPPAWLAEGLVGVDLLGAAGLDEGRTVTLDELRTRVLASSDGVVFAFAGELMRRGMTIEAINLGWELRERTGAWTRGLLELVYPFLYREMVDRAARERGLDPVVVAALVRQESAFDADIVSSAGAVGLMQVMPATGRDLARREGPEDFTVESLEAPEVNLHLGSRFLRDMWDRYDGDLSLILSAYNAGPSRASEWRRFPEAVDPLLFIERIPFRETRDYVKLVTRNVSIYSALYGDPR
jgi:soluble lytic murein transglycosylase